MSLVIDIACMDLLKDEHGNYVCPDFKRAYAAGVRGVYLRRSWCYFDAGHQAFVLRHDPAAGFAQAARDAGLVVGLYEFPCFDEGAPSPAEQNANFFAGPGDVRHGEDMPVCLDVEFPGSGIAATRQSQAEVLELVRLHVEGLAEHCGASPALYTSHVEWHDDNGLGGPAAPWASACPLWQKTPYRVPAGQPLDQVAPRTPHDDADSLHDRLDLWRTPLPWRGIGCALQQFQGDCRGIDGVHQCDVSLLAAGWYSRKLGARQVRDVQAAHGLLVDGIYGLRTFCALAWE